MALSVLLPRVLCHLLVCWAPRSTENVLTFFWLQCLLHIHLLLQAHCVSFSGSPPMSSFSLWLLLLFSLSFPLLPPCSFQMFPHCCGSWVFHGQHLFGDTRSSWSALPNSFGSLSRIFCSLFFYCSFFPFIHCQHEFWFRKHWFLTFSVTLLYSLCTGTVSFRSRSSLLGVPSSLIHGTQPFSLSCCSTLHGRMNVYLYRGRQEVSY